MHELRRLKVFGTTLTQPYGLLFLCCLSTFQISSSRAELAIASQRKDDPLSATNPSVVATTQKHIDREQVLQSIRTALEGYSDEVIRRVLDSAPNQIDETTLTTGIPSTTTRSSSIFHDELEEQLRDEASTTTRRSSPGVFKVRADLRSSSASNSAEERPLTRHHRSARHGSSDWPFGHQHRRRRKGCPPLHGKEQLLCPSRNPHRYDVCISREQLCDHEVNCPDGEDEDPRQCFFYKPLDDQLKTLSHAVLLLIDNVAQQKKQEL
ncbi:hypothetical protein M3Y98_00484300 [Aphelenchoides besseyi]|nr:hypothetical protein M3Y98_00484300 [Aphelenchoides besseyi]